MRIQPFVHEDGTLAGVITEKDVLELMINSENQPGTVEDYMTHEVLTFEESDSLVDIQMPVLNGYLAVQAIRSHGLRVPIVAVTAYATTEHQQRAIDAGCDRFLAKPFRIGQLVEAIRTYVTETQVG